MCKGCKNRYPGCHSKCEEYIQYTQENKMKKERIRKLKDYEDTLDTIAIEGRKRRTKAK